MEDLDKLYQSYRTAPTPETLYPVVRALRPTIDQAVNQVGGTADPMIREQAKLFTADAIASYDPRHGAGLPTWVSRQLMQLRRFKRERSTAMRVPERVQLDAYAIDRAEKEIFDETGQDATLEQLAARTKFPLKRIRKVRESFRRMPGEAAFDTGEGSSVVGYETDFGGEALDYIYTDADDVDKRIIELTTGYAGKEPLTDANAIAAKLRISPAQVSRRRMRIGLQVQDTERLLQETAGGR